MAETTTPAPRKGIASRTVAVARAHRGVTAAIVVALLGLAVFVLVWFEPQKAFINQTVAEDLPVATATVSGSPGTQSSVLATGTFRGLDHDASGSASLVRVDGTLYVRFEKDFQVLNGPDLLVYLSKHDASSDASRFATGFVSLGELKGNRGSQNYAIPAKVDPAEYRSVVVWCRRFNVGFAVAPLEQGT
jgi:hypothetical protein